MADLFSDASRNYLVLNKPQIPQFEEIVPTVSKIWGNMKIMIFRLGDYLKHPKKVFSNNIKFL